MVLGMSLAAFTILHVVISLVGIGTGLIVLLAMGSGRHLPGLTFVFIATTLLTTLTGFLFPLVTITPAVLFGIISSAVLLALLTAIYGAHFAGRWRTVYVLTATFACYLNAFVGIVQSFLKVPFLHPLAPNGNEPPLAIAQGLLLVLFVWLGWRALKHFHPLRTPPL
jgi:hypothetical protein